MATRRVTTVRQLELMVNFMLTHRQLALGRLCGKEYAATAHKLWEQLAEIRNSEGPSRIGKEWAKIWTEIKSKVRKKLMDERAGISGTGGEPHSSCILTPLQEQIADIIGRDVGPIPGGRVHGQVPKSHDHSFTQNNMETEDEDNTEMIAIAQETINYDHLYESMGATCKARWHKIRENYRKALNLRKTKSGQATDKIKPPKYHQELSFLTPYLNDEETRRSNIPDISRPCSSQDISNSPDYTRSPDYIIDSPSGGGDSPCSDLSLTTSRFSNAQKRRYTTPFRAPFSPIDQRSTAATVLKDYLSRTEQTQNQQIKSESDTLIDFFMTMAKTVAKFPVNKQLKIKSQLFQTVHSVECEIAKSSSVTEETVLPSRIMSSATLTQSITATSTSPTSAVTFSHPGGNEIQTYEIITPPINTAPVSSQEQREEDALTSGTVYLANNDEEIGAICVDKIICHNT